MRHSVFILVWLLAETSRVSALGFLPVVAGSNKPIWGVSGGLVWAVPPTQFGENPRGLIRLAYPVLPNGRYSLINFIAIEPVVGGRRGYSELEPSSLDGAPGKRIWSESPCSMILTNPPRGLSNAPVTGKEIEVQLKVEKFDNGAHVWLLVRQRLDKPDEIEFGVFAEPDSSPLDYCILTATMGNFARARQLWLKDEVVSSLRLYPDYKATGFAPKRQYPSFLMRRTMDGRLLAAITTDEESPATVYPFPGTQQWYYGGFKVTQYWATPADSSGADLAVVVNGRYVYWQSERPVPGGIAFENFELIQRFSQGQRFVFGITRQPPRDLGFPGDCP